jgi:hypothetical protein
VSPYPFFIPRFSQELTLFADYFTETETYYPPDQTVCYAETTETHFYQGPPVTKWDVDYVTYYTFATVWYG